MGLRMLRLKIYKPSVTNKQFWYSLLSYGYEAKTVWGSKLLEGQMAKDDETYVSTFNKIIAK